MISPGRAARAESVEGNSTGGPAGSPAIDSQPDAGSERPSNAGRAQQPARGGLWKWKCSRCQAAWVRSNPRRMWRCPGCGCWFIRFVAYEPAG